MRALSLAALLAGPAFLTSPAWGSDRLTFTHLSTYETAVFDEGAAEIVVYSAQTQSSSL